MTATAETIAEEAPAREISLLGVIPLGRIDPARWEASDARLGTRLVPYEDIAALVCDAPPAGLEADPQQLTARHWEVHRALLHGDVVPAPAGITFGGEVQVAAFLTESYATLRGALARGAGRWEFRLHIRLADRVFPQARALDLATHIYAELRRISAAASTTSGGAEDLIGAAFLVDRDGSPAFRDRVDALSRINSALELELTGPWPAYDFVRMHA